jgi:hypothetical protein
VGLTRAAAADADGDDELVGDTDVVAELDPSPAAGDVDTEEDGETAIDAVSDGDNGESDAEGDDEAVDDI